PPPPSSTLFPYTTLFRSTRILPVPAPTGTVAVICVGDWTVKTDGELLKLTLVAPVRLTPVMVTIVPIFPLAGEKPVMTGVVLTRSEEHTSELQSRGHLVC